MKLKTSSSPLVVGGGLCTTTPSQMRFKLPLSNMLFDYEAWASSVDSNGLVQQLIDISGSNKNGIVQSNATVRPAYSSRSNINHRQAITFSGSQYLYTNASLGLVEPYTIIMVAVTTNTGNIVLDGATSSPRSGLWNQFSNTLVAFTDTGSISTTTTPSSPFLAIITFNGASSWIRINGVQSANSTLNITGTLQQMIFGSRYSLSNFWSGDVCSFGCIPRVISGAEITALENPNLSTSANSFFKLGF